MTARNDCRRTGIPVPRRIWPSGMTVAEAIRELGDEVFRALPLEVSEDLEVTLRALGRPEAELPERLLATLAQMIPEKLRKRLIYTKYYKCGTSGYQFPSVQVKCTIDKSEISAGEYATVLVTVHGDAVYQTQPVPTAVVITLDESGSMAVNQNYAESRNAALALINSLRSTDEIALVTFSETAVVRSNLTTDHQSVKQILQNLDSPSGSTNLEQAFAVSDNVVKTSQNSFNRIVILFTDGMPTPDPSLQEKNILNILGQAQTDLIQYFPVAYGNSVPVALLTTIAQKTGGEVFFANQIEDLANFFQTAFDEVKTTLFARDVCITEIVNPEFMIRQGSFNYSIASGDEPSGFKMAMQNAEANFYKTGTLTVPPIHLLDKNRNFTFSYDITAKQCAPNDVVRQVTNPQSLVTYSAGAKSKLTTYIQPVSVKVKACGVYWKKYFDQASHRVTVEISNSFPDRSVSSIRVTEVPGEEVELLVGTAQPAWPVARPYYPSHAKDVWKGPWAVEWNWTEIPPKTTQNFSVEVRLRPGVKAAHGFDNPVQINQVRVAPIVEPDGTISNQPKEGGTIGYCYMDHNGDEQKVLTDLPGLPVPDLPLEWPYK